MLKPWGIFVQKSLLIAFALSALNAPAEANVIYKYKGNRFIDISQDFLPEGYNTFLNVQGHLELLTELIPNMPLTDVSGSVQNFLLSDGINTITPTTLGIEEPFPVFQLGTDDLGRISEWNVNIRVGPDVNTTGLGGGFQILTISAGFLTLDEGHFDLACREMNLGVCVQQDRKQGEIQDFPGRWTKVAAVPLPGTLGLLSMGLLGLRNFRRKFQNKRLGEVTSA